MKELAVVLAIELGDSVRAARLRRHGLHLGHCRIVSIDGGGAAQHSLLDTGMAGFFEHGEEPGNVEFLTEQWVRHRFGDADHRGEVKEIVNALHRFAHDVAIRDPSMKVCFSPDRLAILPLRKSSSTRISRAWS